MRKKLLMKKNALREKRKRRVRGKIYGTSEVPRVTVFRSNRHFYAQAIDDTKGHTLASADGCKLNVRANKEGAIAVAKAFSEALKAKGIEKVVFDKNGYKYHGVVAAFADTLREDGIKL